MIISLVLVTIVYVLTTYTLQATLTEEQLSGNIRPFYTMVELTLGRPAGIAMSVVAILTITAMAQSGLLAASRFPFAMSRDNLLPSFFGKISSKYLTPFASIVTSSLLIFVILSVGNTEKIAKLASTFMILMFIIVNLSVIILRENHVSWYNPTYKSPFYPFTQILGIISGIILLSSMIELTIKGIIGITLPGLFLYFLYGRNQSRRKGVIGIKSKRNDLISTNENHLDNYQLEPLDFKTNSKVVVALFGKEKSSEALIETGISLCDHQNLEVAHINEIPEQTNINDIIEEPADLRSLRRRVIAIATEKKSLLTLMSLQLMTLLKQFMKLV